MTRVLKILLLCLLMAALPIQGLAAAVKASCGPSHHSAVPSVMMADLDHHGMDAGDQHHDAAGHSAPDAAAANASADHAAAGKGAHGYCSACAVCCVGAVAPPSVSLWISDHGGSETVVIPPASFATGYIPASPERPPRHISA